MFFINVAATKAKEFSFITFLGIKTNEEFAKKKLGCNL